MTAFIVGARLDYDVSAVVGDVIGPFPNVAAAHEFADKHCPPHVVDARTQWYVVAAENCDYSPQAWIDLQLGDDE